MKAVVARLGFVGALVLIGTMSAAAEDAPALKRIRHVDLIHLSHTDVGYTDHPLVCRQQQMRYLDLAIDAVLASSNAAPDARFAWTAEANLTIGDWWQAASPTRRQELLKAIATERLELTALAMNQTPTLNAAQWQTMVHWLPEELWQQARPRLAIQDDVNALPRAGALALLDRGVDQLLMGINPTLGDAPVRRPSAFWWKMPDGRRMFVWLGDQYPAGFWYFYPENWRRGPVPESTDTRYRPPRPGEIYATDEASLRAAHANFVKHLQEREAGGYAYPTLIISVTNEWRIDNDPPYPQLADFVAAWNRLGLKPDLRLTTAGEAVSRLRKEVGGEIPEYTGEWPDWWANGGASGPREVAASRRAKRLLAAAVSPVWGPLEPRAAEASEAILRELCLFDEHTWGASDSVGQPHTLETWAQYNEKSRTAYQPMALAKLLLAQRARTAVNGLDEGLFVANTAPQPVQGWITMPSSCLRGNFHSLEDPQTGRRVPLEFEPGYRPHTRLANPSELTIAGTSETFPDNAPNQQVRFWLEPLVATAIRRYVLSEKEAEPEPVPTPPEVTLDAQGWPVTAAWKGMTRPLFEAGTGELFSIGLEGFASRWTYMELFMQRPGPDRDERMGKLLHEITAVPKEAAKIERNAHTTIYTQTLQHPRLKWATRQLELDHQEPHARLTIRFHRMESELPEFWYTAANVPTDSQLPTTSNGGVPFVPYEDQLPGSCRDYFSIDSWVQYATPAGRWLWATRDAPLVSFGAHDLLARRTTAPQQPGRILAMLFNNLWFTNFVADSHGAFEFQFDLAWQTPSQAALDPGQQAEALLAEPQVVINPKLRESPTVSERLHRP